jgi:competence protein ComEC
MISIGILNIRLHDDQQFRSHFTNQIILPASKSHTITFKIREVLKPSAYYDKYVIEVLDINSKKVSGKSLLNLQKDSTKQQ